MEIMNYMDIDRNSRMPMYQQIIDYITNNISNGIFELNQKLPSINTLSEDYYLSRDTVEKAYGILKESNIIASIPRRGYYVAKAEKEHKLKILFLINKLSFYEMKIYNAFCNKLGRNSNIDLVVYHCDELLFLNALKNNELVYDHYVIIPHFKKENLQHTSFTNATLKALNNIPESKLLVLDNIMPSFAHHVPTVYQEFDKDIYEALKKGIKKISKYNKMVFIFPEKSFYPYPRRILLGFKRFCIENSIDFEICNQVCDDMIFEKGDLFITVEESDLVILMNKITESGLLLGAEIGVLSYNDTPLKDLLGIAVMSTDFLIMGETAAQIVLGNMEGSVKVPFRFIDRKSI